MVEADAVLGPERVRDGDVVVAMASSGLHSNGYSLVRHVLLGAGRLRLDTIVESMLTVSNNYTAEMLARSLGLANGGNGSSAAGLRGVIATLKSLGVPTAGVMSRSAGV